MRQNASVFSSESYCATVPDPPTLWRAAASAVLFPPEITALGRGRCERSVGAPRGYRNGTRERHLLGSFGPVQVSVPRARMADAGGGTQEWRSAALRPDDPAGGGGDRRGLSGRGQHAPGPARAFCHVPGDGG